MDAALKAAGKKLVDGVWVHQDQGEASRLAYYAPHSAWFTCLRPSPELEAELSDLWSQLPSGFSDVPHERTTDIFNGFLEDGVTPDGHGGQRGMMEPGHSMMDLSKGTPCVKPEVLKGLEGDKRQACIDQVSIYNH